MKQIKDDSGTKPEEHPQAKLPGKGPSWSSEFGRVKVSVWPASESHARPSIGIFREYIDWKAKDVKRVFYFDKDDLFHVKAAVDAALEHLD